MRDRGFAHRRIVPAGVLLALLGAGRPAAAQQGKYIGPGSCAASACHGSVRPRNEIRILQNEYSVWATKDKHAKAFAVLSNPVSVRIAKTLRLGKADEAPRCLACHALDVGEGQRGRPFDRSDGVSCELCHGPSTGWLGPHTIQGSSHANNVRLGMYDTKDLVKRTEKCLTCHLGTPEKFVDHELIGAGHPDLVFELDSFQAVMPRHWKEPADPMSGVRGWAVGQAVQLREQLARVADRAKDKTWPEYAELDCFACHHSLTPPEDSWRQATSFPGRKAGNIPFNLSRWVVYRQLLREIASADAPGLETDVERLYAAMSTVYPNREETASIAREAGEAAAALVPKVEAATYDADLVRRVIAGIAGDADTIAFAGERAAEQAAMALDSLWVAWSKSGGQAREKDVKPVLDEMFKHLENPSGYNAPRFAALLKRLGETLK